MVFQSNLKFSWTVNQKQPTFRLKNEFSILASVPLVSTFTVVGSISTLLLEPAPSTVLLISAVVFTVTVALKWATSIAYHPKILNRKIN